MQKLKRSAADAAAEAGAAHEAALQRLAAELERSQVLPRITVIFLVRCSAVSLCPTQPLLPQTMRCCRQ